MSEVFRDRTSCNPDISNWNVSNVTNFESMFQDAPLFNQDLSSWDVSSSTKFVSAKQNDPYNPSCDNDIKDCTSFSLSGSSLFIVVVISLCECIPQEYDVL